LVPRRPPQSLPEIARTTQVRLVIDEQHLSSVVEDMVSNARVSLWIATANVKDMMVVAPLGSTARAKNRYVSMLERLSTMVGSSVEVRLLHASAPSRAFARSLSCHPALQRGLAMRMCPRNHMKLIVVDGRTAYVGSANFTGAGLGAKGSGRRNFEVGMIVDDDVLLDVLQARYDEIWEGRACKGCRLRSACPEPIDTLDATRKDAQPRSGRA